MRVLVIEPDFVLGKLYLESLSAEGLEVAVVSGSQKAVSHLDSNSVNIIVLELQIADHNGVEFIYELRSYPEWQDIPIVIHTMIPPDTSLLDKQNLKTLGVVAYMYKPTTSLAKLTSVVKNFLPATV